MGRDQLFNEAMKQNLIKDFENSSLIRQLKKLSQGKDDLDIDFYFH